MMRVEVARLNHMKRSIFFFIALFAAASTFAQQPPEIRFHSVPDFLKLPPDLHLGEVAGVAVISGNMMLMPGLPKVPRASSIDVDDSGAILGV